MHCPQPDVEAAIGAKIRNRRRALGITQMELAAELGISYQQLQKYERGTNRVAASRLYLIAKILRVEVQYFLSD